MKEPEPAAAVPCWHAAGDGRCSTAAHFRLVVRGEALCSLFQSCLHKADGPSATTSLDAVVH